MHALFCETLGLPEGASQRDAAKELNMSDMMYSRMIRGDRFSAKNLSFYMRKAGLAELAMAVLDAHDAYQTELKKAAVAAKGFLEDCLNLHVSREYGRLLGSPEPVTVETLYLVN